MDEPPADTDDPAEEPAPQTFRADLLHQRARRLNRFRRGLIAAAVALLMLAVVGGAHAWRWYLGDLPQIPPAGKLADLGRAPGMTFVDLYGRPIATRGPKYGLAVKLKELPSYVPLAFLAAEDRRFRDHGAVDLWGMARAVVTNLRAGHTREGASTLDQQLARNLFLGPERTLKRKLQEAVLAYRLESELGKDGILELYLNRVYLGENAFGIDAASRAYFGKPASALTLSQAAVLAGLPKAPSRLGPMHDSDAALRRGRLVLARMRREGWITAQDEAKAAAEPVVLVKRAPEGDLGWALDLAAAQARSDAGAQANDLIVRLTIDPAMQKAAGGIVREALDGEGRRVGASQAAVVLLAPDGAIRVLIGGRDHDDSPFNRAVQARRQPGSSFKPFVWAAALDSGLKPTDFRSTERLAFGPWRPNDHVSDKVASLTLADALAQSSNSVSVRLTDEVGVRKVAALALRFGVTSLPEKPGLSLALGAYEVAPLEMAGAYQVFQQGGRMQRPYLVSEVARSDGTVLYRRPQTAAVPVYDPARTSEMISMMAGVIDHGTGRKAKLDRPAAGKTGTTQENRDAWFVGFTPDWVAGVWVGNDDSRPMRGVAGGDLPAEIWRRIMVLAHQGLPVRGFSTVAGGDADPDAAKAGPSVVFEDRSAFYTTLAAEFARTAQSGAGQPGAAHP
jgi:penicillin-binding protein 1A